MKYLKDDDLESNGTINNSNTYERLDINNNFFNIIDNKNIKNNLIHSANNIEIKPKKYKNNTIRIQRIRDNVNGLLNEKNLDEQTNDNNFCANASQNIRTYSQSKYSKNNLNLINPFLIQGLNPNSNPSFIQSPNMMNYNYNYNNNIMPQNNFQNNNMSNMPMNMYKNNNIQPTFPVTNIQSNINPNNSIYNNAPNNS